MNVVLYPFHNPVPKVLSLAGLVTGKRHVTVHVSSAGDKPPR